MQKANRKFWPFDEVSLELETASSDRVLVKAPWLQMNVRISPEHLQPVRSLIEKIKTENIDANDVDWMSWFFSSLAKFPFSYILPRPQISAKDTPKIKGQALSENSPKALLESLATDSSKKEILKNFADRALTRDWTWDQEAALEFSQTAGGHDPETLYSVARRYHLLNDIENNVTSSLLNHVSILKTNPELFKKASALIIRQNHYITEKCDPTLRAALPMAQNAEDEVMEFMQAEAGHDKILLKALESVGHTPEQVPALDTVIVIMEVFRMIAQRNFLAFAMVVDIFERTSYEPQDPMAKVLTEGGEEKAAARMDTHREINDAGEHENVALSFLQHMNAVDAAYAKEALHLAELATLVIHQLSADTLSEIKTYSN